MTVKELYDKVNNGNIISDISLQREIVYDAEKQAMVIDSIVRGIPLPAFYLWRREDGKFEVLDGKQRIEAITKFFHNQLKYNNKVWREYSSDPDFQESINSVELSIIECSGNEAHKREIFYRINTLGVPLSDFEVLNGLYPGEYLEGLKNYYRGNPVIRKVVPLQSPDRGKSNYTILRYLYYIEFGRFPDRNQINVYVKMKQDESFNGSAERLRPYVSFIKDVFTERSKIPSQLKFTLSVKYLRNRTIWLQHRDDIIMKVNDYMKSDDFKLSSTKDKDIEAIILSICGNIALDPRRFFSREERLQLLSQSERDSQGLYVCASCHQHFAENEMHVDHVRPWSLGGRTELSNAQLLCHVCNERKNNNYPLILQ